MAALAASVVMVFNIKQWYLTWYQVCIWGELAGAKCSSRVESPHEILEHGLASLLVSVCKTLQSLLFGDLCFIGNSHWESFQSTSLW